jgi:uncharacterized protein YjbJ (UPF0337 family)
LSSWRSRCSAAEADISGVGGADRFGVGQDEFEPHVSKEAVMKSAENDKLKGTFHQVKGQVKETVGKLTDNPKLQAKGVAEKTTGKVQKKLGEVKKALS